MLQMHRCHTARPLPEKRVRSFRLLLTTCLVTMFLTVLRAGISTAQMGRPDTLAWRPNPNEMGFTLGDMLDGNILNLVRHPLSPETLSHVGANVHRAPHRGVQFELLTPGDVGGTFHFRW